MTALLNRFSSAISSVMDCTANMTGWIWAHLGAKKHFSGALLLYRCSVYVRLAAIRPPHQHGKRQEKNHGESEQMPAVALEPCTRIFSELRAEIAQSRIARDAGGRQDQEITRPSHAHRTGASREDFERQDRNGQQRRNEHRHHAV